MHEMSLLRDAVDIVSDAVKEADVKAVTKVALAIGDMRDVVEAYVPSLFERLMRGTIAQGAGVEIIHVPMTARCRKCGFVMPKMCIRDRITVGKRIVWFWSTGRCRVV